MELCNDHVLVVARITDLGSIVLVAQMIVRCLDGARLCRLEALLAKLQLERGLVIESDTAAWAIAVDIIEVERCRAEVVNSSRILLLLADRRLVEREIVIHELTEVGIARWDYQVLIVIASVEELALVGLDHRLSGVPTSCLVRTPVRSDRGTCGRSGPKAPSAAADKPR